VITNPTNSDGIRGVSPIGPERTVEQLIARELRESILDGRLQPGVRLPYRDLARQFEVSVTPVRIALRELLTEGLVELRPHGGASVTRLTQEELEELFIMRAGLESWMALLGAPRLSGADVAEISTAFDAIERAASARDRAAYLENAFRYRAICYRRAERPRLLSTASQLFERSGRYMFLSLERGSRIDESLALARTFRDACAARDGERAQHSVREALEWTMTYVGRALRKTLDAA
jgi:DNA-binding GntR family transcriptional regulator